LHSAMMASIDFFAGWAAGVEASDMTNSKSVEGRDRA
jgi:hypothetical protein